jgi:hypothetical protein
MKHAFANSQVDRRTRVNTIYCCALARQTDREAAVQSGNSLALKFKKRGSSGFYGNISWDMSVRDWR